MTVATATKKLTTQDILIANVVTLMENRDVSQVKLAVAMGKSRPWLNKFLNGKHPTALATLDEFAGAFKVTTIFLVTDHT
jgi:transcriptional regulator with XRE-family HTH domain